jgi:hypothetical protein
MTLLPSARGAGTSVVAGLMLVFCGSSAAAFPFGPGGTRIVPDHELRVHGEEIRDASSVIRVPTDRPLFHGTTSPGLLVRLSTDRAGPLGATRADPRGRWILSAPRRLEPGRHALHLELTDEAGVSTGAKLAATFDVPRDIPPGTTAVSAPPLSLREWNDVTVSAAVLGSATLLLVLYLVLRRLNAP